MQRLLQTLLLGCILLLALWVRLPAVMLAGFGLAAVGMIASSRLAGAGLALFWIGSLAAFVGGVLGQIGWEFYYAVLAGLMAGTVWLTSRRAIEELWRVRWNAAVMAWLLCAALLWLGAGYFQNQRDAFYAGLVAMVAVLVLARLWFRWGAPGAQVVNTLILLLVGLPVADLALRPQSRLAVRPETCRLYYSYAAAKGDPAAFARWEEYYTSQFDQLGLEVFTTAPHSIHPFRLRPGSHGMMVNCPISINSLGFRGPEISPAKDGVYRIIAVGESTTFGMTIQPEDKPWPEVLEQIIGQRLKTRRPVQVINAGVPAYTINDALDRLPREILPLKPDMIICYHGANGFSLIDSSVLPPLGARPPVYQERPIKLAADAEHRLRLLLFRYRAQRRNVSANSNTARPLETKYAAAYRQLIQCASANGIRLALANFSMAVNQASNPKVIDFYNGGGARAAYGFIRANAVHSLIVSQLAAEHPEVCFVDTHPHLDGDHEKFIDLIHFTGAGDRQLAENIFTAIRSVLEHDVETRK
ncbi:MAG TPA: GDSL-type esterase/lipase family protein [Candidatus Saccharimonadales bacterium]|nr:GDSL-type esterase/lipase family protein [Candidatus Saccharimonadales bacterium]